MENYMLMKNYMLMENYMLKWKTTCHTFFCFQRQVFSALSQIAKHSVDLAEMVVEAEIFPAVLTCLKDVDEYVKKNVATLIREIAKHTPEVSIC